MYSFPVVLKHIYEVKHEYKIKLEHQQRKI